MINSEIKKTNTEENFFNELYNIYVNFDSLTFDLTTKNKVDELLNVDKYSVYSLIFKLISENDFIKQSELISYVIYDFLKNDKKHQKLKNLLKYRNFYNLNLANFIYLCSESTLSVLKKYLKDAFTKTKKQITDDLFFQKLVKEKLNLNERQILHKNFFCYSNENLNNNPTLKAKLEDIFNQYLSKTNNLPIINLLNITHLNIDRTLFLKTINASKEFYKLLYEHLKHCNKQKTNLYIKNIAQTTKNYLKQIQQTKIPIINQDYLICIENCITNNYELLFQFHFLSQNQPDKYFFYTNTSLIPICFDKNFIEKSLSNLLKINCFDINCYKKVLKENTDNKKVIIFVKNNVKLIINTILKEIQTMNYKFEVYVVNINSRITSSLHFQQFYDNLTYIENIDETFIDLINNNYTNITFLQKYLNTLPKTKIKFIKKEIL